LSGSTERFYVSVRNSGTNTPVTYVRGVLVSPASNGSEYAVSENTWYRIEAHFKADASVGGFEFKVDGNSPGGDTLAINTSGQEIDTIRVGMQTGNALPSNASAMYVDNVKADSSWIGAWSAGTPITWEKSGITTEPKAVIYNGTILTSVNSCLKTCALNTWDWNTNTLYVNVGGDPGNEIEAGQRNYAISNTAKNYITYNNLTLEGSNSGGIIVDSGNYNILDALTVRKIGNGNGYGIFLADDSYAAGHGNHTVENCVLSDIYGDGIFTQRVRNITIDSNIVGTVYAGPGGNSGDNIQLLDSSSVTISRNSVTQLGSNTIKGNIVTESLNGIASGFIVEDNELAYGNFGLGFYQADGIIIRRNKIHNQTTYNGIQGTDDTTGDAQIYDNIIYNVNGGGINLCGSYDRTNIKIYNNVISGITGQYGICLEQFDGEVKNNIIWNSGPASNYAYFVTLKVDGTISSNYNIIGPESATKYISFAGTSYSTLAAYRSGKSQDANSLIFNPLFTSTSDFHLLSTSPAINAGTDVGITADYEGNPISGSAWDIGAYEFQVSTPSVGGGALLNPRTTNTADDTSDEATLEEDTSSNSEDEQEIPLEEVPSSSGTTSVFTFTRHLNIGSEGLDVVELQKILRNHGFFTYPTNTGYYGTITAEAVKQYQTKNGIPALGLVGPLTLAKLNKDAPAPVASKEDEVSTEAFIELLIQLGIIPAEKVAQAREALTERNDL